MQSNKGIIDVGSSFRLSICMICLFAVANGQTTVASELANINRRFRVAVVVNPPFVEKVTRSNGTIAYRGFAIDLLEKLKDMLSFTYSLVDVPSQAEYRELLLGQAVDMVLPLRVTAERENLIDFTVPFYGPVGFILLMKKPSTPMQTPTASLGDLARQRVIKYAPTANSEAASYFRRRADLEARLYDIYNAMARNMSMTPQERAWLEFTDNPIPDTYTNMWRYMQEVGLPLTDAEALNRVLSSPSATEGFAWIGDASSARYAELTNCNVVAVGSEFHRQPFAIGLQKGSPLRNLISGGILRLLDQRELEHLKAKWWNYNPNIVSCK